MLERSPSSLPNIMNKEIEIQHFPAMDGPVRREFPVLYRGTASSEYELTTC